MTRAASLLPLLVGLPLLSASDAAQAVPRGRVAQAPPVERAPVLLAEYAQSVHAEGDYVLFTVSGLSGSGGGAKEILWLHDVRRARTTSLGLALRPVTTVIGRPTARIAS